MTLSEMSLPVLETLRYRPIGDLLQISVLREDKVHPYLGGNKWRKLKYNLVDFRNSGKKVILTFGGAYSNHLVASATAGAIHKIPMIGIVRGEENSNPCLDYIRSQGMILHFMNRQDYRRKNDELFITTLLTMLRTQGLIPNEDDVFVLPEGGSNLAATLGTAEMNDYLSTADHIFCPAGTGGTAAGISKRLLSGQILHVVPVLKAENFLVENILRWGGSPDRMNFHFNYHFGGYAKLNDELLHFCSDFKAETGIPVEPVYSGKMFYAFTDLAKKGAFNAGSKIILIHTGGIYPFYTDFQKNKKKKLYY